MTPTPSQIEAHRRHQERLQRIAARAVVPTMPVIPIEPVTSILPPVIALPPEAITPIPAMAIHIPWIEAPDIISIDKIKRVVAAHYGMTARDLASSRRDKFVVMPRHIAIWIAKQMTAFSLPQIGHHMGHRDHTTVLHAIRKISRLRAQDQAVAEVCDEIIRKLEGSDAR